MNDTTNTSTATTPAPKLSPKDVFETEACSRCGGSGQYSYCQMYGTKCFGCAGLGWQYTRHGRKNRDAWKAAVDAATIRPVSEVKPGDYVKMPEWAKYFKVVAVSGPKTTGHSISPDGTKTPFISYDITFDRKIKVSSFFGAYTSDTHSTAASIDMPTVCIHPGNDLMPKMQDFVTAKRKARAAKAEAGA